MDAISGQEHVVTFHLLVEDRYVVPDTGSMKYTVLDNSGAVSGLLNNVAIADGSIVDEKVNITLSSSVQTVASGKSFEQRTVEFVFTVGGQKYRLIKHYYVTARLNYRCSPEQVFSLLGIKDGEDFYDAVDFVKAYFELAEALGSSALTTALSSGGLSQLRANEMICYAAAIDMATSLELKALRKAGGDALNFQRFEKVDFESIRSRLSSKLQSLTDQVTGTSVTPEVFIVAPTTDAWTGAS